MISRTLTSLATLFLLSGIADAASPRLQKCIGSVVERVSIADFKECESFTLSKKVTARQKAQIFLQLGITVSTEQINSGSMHFKNKPSLSVDYWEKAIAADRTYAEPYLILSTTFGYKQQAEAKRQYLEAGRIAVPDDPRFDSEIALIEAKPGAAAIVSELCERATAHPSADESVFYNCGEAFWQANLKTEAEVAFRKAVFDFPVARMGRFGIMQSSISASTFATHLDEDNRTAEAAEFFEKYVARQPKINVDFTELELIGDLYLKAGKPQQAAMAFERGARQTTDDMQYQFRLRQLVSLATAGNNAEAKILSSDIYKRTSKKQIMQLQLKLKNGVFKRLAITGRFDEETKTALAKCLEDSKCFGKMPGQLL
jgi:predicted Zn-dependent protease